MGSMGEEVDVENLIRQKRAALKSSFRVQSDALIRKNLRLQSRRWGNNACLVSFPILLFVLLVVLQVVFDTLIFNTDDNKCGCKCVPEGQKGCVEKCGLEYSTAEQAAWCPVPRPPMNPALLQMPNVTAGRPWNSFTTMVPITGNDRAIAEAIGARLFSNVDVAQNTTRGAMAFASIFPSQSGSSLSMSANVAPPIAAGTTVTPDVGNIVIEKAILGKDNEWDHFFVLSNSCTSSNSTWDFQKIAFNGSSLNISFIPQEMTLMFSLGCYQANYRFFPSEFTKESLQKTSLGFDAKTSSGFSRSIDAVLYNRYLEARPKKKEIEYVPGVIAAYDFKNSSTNKLDLHVWYNKTYAFDEGAAASGAPPATLRLSRSFNLAANAFVSWATDGRRRLSLLFVKDFPKVGTKLSIDVSSFIGPLFYIWVLELLLPVIVGNLVYEKEARLRTMMKMHGLGDDAYWAISYSYFLVLSVVYMFFFVAVGNITRIKFFTLNDTSIILVFLFVFVNNQIAFGFLWTSLFGSVKTATVSSYLYVFGSGLLAEYLYKFFLEDPKTSRGVIFAMELVPAFSLQRGLYELAQYSFQGNYQNTKGMTWSNLSDDQNGLNGAIGVLLVEWILFLMLSLYFDQVFATGTGVAKHPLFFLDCLKKKKSDGAASRAVGARGRKAAGKETEMAEIVGDGGVKRADGAADVAAEREVVEASLRGEMSGLSIVCDNLQKVFKGSDGNPDKIAVAGMSLAISRGECFGMLGPNGAGKTTSINMMVGFLEPTAGKALIEGMDIRTDMQSIYSMMGVCPQHDLLWDTLTGREHLLFYGRLKNLKGEKLDEDVDMWLRKMNLFAGGVGSKAVKAYSGGMKRRLSVAISLIGNPLVVYMDEPSTGLDPASRNNLWSVVKAAKKGRAIILTTHSMEEAEVLCDRLGIFVDGKFACIGNPKELTSRYGGTYDFTVTTSVEDESAAEALARSLSRNVKKIYSLGGTQKFELPSSEVDLADVFAAVEKAKKTIAIRAWGIANTTLEDVFIKVAGKDNRPLA